MSLDVKKMLIGGLAAGAAITIVQWIVYFAVLAVFPFDMMSLGGMRPVNDPLMILWFLHPFVLGLAMAAAFQKFKGSFAKTGWCRGKAFGIFAWLLVGLPSAFLVWTSMDYPIGFTVNSLLGTLLYLIAAGLVLEKVSA